MIGLCLGELPLGYFVLSPVHHAGRGRPQANRGINAVGFSKLTKYCDSFRLCPLLLGGHTFEFLFMLEQKNSRQTSIVCRKFLIENRHILNKFSDRLLQYPH